MKIIYCCDGAEGFHASDCDYASKGEPDTESEAETDARRQQNSRWPNAGELDGAEL